MFGDGAAGDKEGWIRRNRTRSIDAEAGEEYYIRGTFFIGFWYSELRVEIASDTETKEDIKAARYPARESIPRSKGPRTAVARVPEIYKPPRIVILYECASWSGRHFHLHIRSE
jgi:hypothetical protein